MKIVMQRGFTLIEILVVVSILAILGALVVLALLIWGLISAWLWLVKRGKTENQHGLAALAGMRWREFSQIVHRAMSEQRQLRELENDEESTDRGTSSDFLMEGSERWLISAISVWPSCRVKNTAWRCLA